MCLYKKFFIWAFGILALCLIFTSCSEDNNKTTGPSTSSPRGVVIEDEIEEELPGFVDITSIEYYIDSTTIIITFNLRSLPPTLTFNSPDLENGTYEYWWYARFYVFGSNDYSMNLVHEKFEGAEEITGPILQNCDAMLWEWIGYDSFWIVDNIEAKIFSNKIQLTVNKSISTSLSQITSDCHIKFHTEYSNGIESASDEVTTE